MDNRTYMTLLFDYYGELFNDKQRQYFEAYYFNNLSLAEISKNSNVSRNAVHKQIKTVEDKLVEYEETLKLYAKSKKINSLLAEMQDKELIKKIQQWL